MTLAIVYVAGFIMGWQLKLLSVRRQAPFVMRQDTQWSRAWREKHGMGVDG